MSDVECLGGWYGMLMTEGILDILPRSMVLEEEDPSENLELVECLWKESLTFPSVNWVMSLIWTFGWGSCMGCGGVAPSRIHSSGRVMSFHWMAFGTTVFALDRSVCRSVAPLLEWCRCLDAKAENIAL